MISDDNDDDNNSIARSRNNHPQDADLRCYDAIICKQPTYLRYFNIYIFRFRSYLVTDVGRILDAKGGCMNFREA